MQRSTTKNPITIRSRARVMGVLDGAAWLAGLTLVVTSAIWTKQTGALPAMVGIAHSVEQIHVQSTVFIPAVPQIQAMAPTPEAPVVSDPEIESIEPEPVIDPSYRWFDGKLVRPTRVIYMTVTGYSPDARSCGEFADGKTATMNSVWTNGMKLVAADPRVLPYWSMISVPGYAGSEIVPVLDCGGAIKGNRLDLLYPTHKLALQWGVRQVPVTVWEYVESE